MIDLGSLILWAGCIAGGVYLLALAATVALSGASRSGNVVSTGVTMWEGLPGSGKSYGVTEAIVGMVRRNRRPIYTNVPLKFRSLRKYLKKVGGAASADYVTKLSREHFSAFLFRFAELAEYCEKQQAVGVARKHAERDWLDRVGPHVPRPMGRAAWDRYRTASGVSEADASAEWVGLAKSADGTQLLPNWIDYGSVIVVDEVHKWFDQRKQGDKPAPGEKKPPLLDVLSMHRHGLYRIEAMSQDVMQVDIAFRRQCANYVRCADLRQLPFLWGIRFPLPSFRYQLIPAAALESAADRAGAKPIRTWTRHPWANGGYLWRLYDSFTHCGSQRQLGRIMERSRQAVEGENYDPQRSRKEDAMRKRRESVVVSAAKLMMLGAVVLGAWWIGGGGTLATAGAATAVAGEAPPGASPASRPAAPPASAAAVHGPVVGVPPVPPVPPPPPTGAVSVPPSFGAGLMDRLGGAAANRRTTLPSQSKLAAIGPDYVVVEGKVVVRGENLGTWTLVAVDVRRGLSLWLEDGRTVPWSLGGTRVVTGLREDSAGDTPAGDAPGGAAPAVARRPGVEPVAPRPDARGVDRYPRAWYGGSGGEQYARQRGLGRDDGRRGTGAQPVGTERDLPAGGR